MAKFFSCVQGSAEWLDLRLGKPTASQFHRIITPKTNTLSSQSKLYMYELCAELVTGQVTENISTGMMERGHRMEPKAVEFYEFTRDVKTTPVGFVTVDSGRYGASPDRLIEGGGLLEVKSPGAGIHAGYLLGENGVDGAYNIQVQGQLLCAERDWSDIISFHPLMPEAVVRVYRDDELIGKLAAALEQFCDQLAEMALRLQALIPPRESRRPPVVDYIPPWLDISDEEIEAWVKGEPAKQEAGAA